MSSNTASSSNQYHCFRLCPQIHNYQNLIVYLSFHCYLTSLKYHWFLIHSCYNRPCSKTEIPTHLQRRILYSTVVHCTADRNKHVCSMCFNQQVLSIHQTVPQITHCMQAPYKTLVYAYGLKCQAHRTAARIFYFIWEFKFSKFSVLERNSIKWIWCKQKLIGKEQIYLDAYECVIIQFVSVFITMHLFSMSSVFLPLHSVQRDM